MKEYRDECIHYRTIEATGGFKVARGVPAMSNDKSALDALDFNGKALPSPVLRMFDLLAFGYQIGVLEEKDCDKARKELLQIGEHVPGVFRKASFINGLANFSPRILDGAVGGVGALANTAPGYAVSITLTKK